MQDLDLAIDIHNPPPDMSGKDVAVLRLCCTDRLR